LQVAIVVTGEISLLARQPGKKTRQHVLDLVPFDVISAGPLLEEPELCTAVAKMEAEVLLVGRAAFEEHLAEQVRWPGGELCLPMLCANNERWMRKLLLWIREFYWFVSTMALFSTSCIHEA
jgi:CRP-like cAMP-binding protein